MHKLIITPAGNTLCNPNSIIRVRMPDGEYADVAVKEAHKYKGATTFFEKKYINKDPAELEERLLQAEEGPHACFKTANEMLFEKDEITGEDITILSLILNECRDGESKKKFAYEIHEFLECGTEFRYLRPTLEEKGLSKEKIGELVSGKVVKPISIVEWFDSVIAPDNWMLYRGLSLMSAYFEPASEFKEFFDDFIDYKIWQGKAAEGSEEPSPSVASNRYSAYLTYCGCRQLLGRRGKSICSSPRKKSRTNPAKTQITGTGNDLDAVKKYLKEQFFKDITESIIEVPIINVQDVKSPRDRKKHRKRSSETMRKGVIFITPDNTLEIDVPVKSLYDICKEVIVVERTLTNHAKHYLFENEKHHIKTDDERIYLVRTMEEIARYGCPPINKKFPSITEKRAKELDMIAERSYNSLFVEENAGEKEKAFRKLHRAYKLLLPLYPNQFDEILRLNAERSDILEEIENRKMNRKQKKKASKKEKLLLREIKKYEKNGWWDKALKNIKSLPSEHVQSTDGISPDKRLDNLAPSQMLRVIGLPPQRESVALVRKNYYSINEIRDVLIKYGGEALLDDNVEITMLKTIFKFIPSEIFSPQPGTEYETHAIKAILPRAYL